MNQIMLCRIHTGIPHIRVAGKVVLGIKQRAAADLTKARPENNLTPDAQVFSNSSQERHATLREKPTDSSPDGRYYLAQRRRCAPGAGVKDLVQLLSYVVSLRVLSFYHMLPY
jgi:hypothetical protein